MILEISFACFAIETVAPDSSDGLPLPKRQEILPQLSAPEFNGLQILLLPVMIRVPIRTPTLKNLTYGNIGPTIGLRPDGSKLVSFLAGITRNGTPPGAYLPLLGGTI